MNIYVAVDITGDINRNLTSSFITSQIKPDVSVSVGGDARELIVVLTNNMRLSQIDSWSTILLRQL